MPSILPPAPDMQDQDSLQEMQSLAPPCEYAAHEQVCSIEPATWVVFYNLSRSCPCAQPYIVLFCDPCWRWRNGVGRTRCAQCGRVFDCMETVLRVERL